MQKWVDFLGGHARLRLTGVFPERFLNICAENGLRFWDVERPDGCTVELSMELRHARRAGPYAKRACCEMEILSRRGAPPFLWRFRRRFALISGMAAALAAVFVLNGFIWEISSPGGERISSARVLEAARQEGVYIGAKSRSISPREISDRIIMNLEGEVSWVAVNVNGSRAEILINETLPRQEAVDPKTPADIVASMSGIVTEVRGYAGTKTVLPGEPVQAGDVLISSWVKMGGREKQVRAMGEVWAVTDREFSAVSPLVRTRVAPDEPVRRTFSLLFGEKRLNLYADYGVFSGEYDIITNWESLPLPGGGVLPLGTVTQEAFPRGGTFTLDAAAEERRLKENLLARIEKTVGDDGKIYTCDFTSRTEQNILTVTAKAVCLEKISVTAELAAPY